MQIETFTKDKDARVYLTWEDISMMRNALYHYQKPIMIESNVYIVIGLYWQT